MNQAVSVSHKIRRLAFTILVSNLLEAEQAVEQWPYPATPHSPAILPSSVPLPIPGSEFAGSRCLFLGDDILLLS